MKNAYTSLRGIGFGIVCLLGTASIVWAGGAGTTTSEFLTLGAGARIPALGGAGVALVDDATALYWNPAAMTRVKNQSAMLMHTAYLDSSYLSQGAYVRKMGSVSAVGANLHYFNAGSIDGTDPSLNSIGSFTPSDMAFTIGYARPIGPVDVGLGGKYIQSKLVDTASTFALDMGVLTHPLVNASLRLGASLSNLGGSMKFDNENEDLPMIIRTGGAYQITNRLMGVLDLNFLKNDDAYLAGGFEYKSPIGPDWSAAGRVGYNTGTAGDVSGLTGVTFGAGISRKSLAIDYSLVPQGDLGMTHWISLVYRE